MAQELRVFEYTNENFYEIVWNARLQFFKEKFSTEDNVQDVLTEFRQIDMSCQWEAHAVKLPETESEPERVYYTGEVSLIPMDAEKARSVFSVAEDANNKQIAAILDQIDESIDAVVELGAGYGGNLIRLDAAYLNRNGKSLSEGGIKLFMAEYTGAGRGLCAEFLKFRNAPDMELVHIDHKTPDVSFLGQAGSSLILTVHSIEQVAEIPTDYFKVLSQAAPRVRGMHFEPVGFQFEPDQPKWETHAKMMKDKDWNQNFAEVIRQAEQDGDIIIDEIDTGFAEGQGGNPTTLVKWHSSR